MFMQNRKVVASIMEEKRKPEIHLIGTENNMMYHTLFELYLGVKKHLSWYCIKPWEKVDFWEMGYAMRTAEIVFVLVGSKADYKALCPIVRKMPAKSIFIFEDFPGRERCLRKCKDYKVLLVKKGCGVIRVVKELISILMSNHIFRLDSQDILACSDRKTVVNYCRFDCADDAIVHMKKEIFETKKDETKFFSLVFVEGEFALTELLKITETVNGEEDSTLVGCRYKEKTGVGILWFVCEKQEEPEEETEWQNPFRKEPLKWFKRGFFVTAIISIILAAKLLSLDDAGSGGDKQGNRIVHSRGIDDTSGCGGLSCGCGE